MTKYFISLCLALILIISSIFCVAAQSRFSDVFDDATAQGVVYRYGLVQSTLYPDYSNYSSGSLKNRFNENLPNFSTLNMAKGSILTITYSTFEILSTSTNYTWGLRFFTSDNQQVNLALVSQSGVVAASGSQITTPVDFTRYEFYAVGPHYNVNVIGFDVSVKPAGGVLGSYSYIVSFDTPMNLDLSFYRTPIDQQGRPEYLFVTFSLSPSIELPQGQYWRLAYQVTDLSGSQSVNYLNPYLTQTYASLNNYSSVGAWQDPYSTVIMSGVRQAGLFNLVINLQFHLDENVDISNFSLKFEMLDFYVGDQASDPLFVNSSDVSNINGFGSDVTRLDEVIDDLESFGFSEGGLAEMFIIQRQFSSGLVEYGPGIKFVSDMINLAITKYSWLVFLLTLSLVVGLFGFIFNVTSSVSRGLYHNRKGGD